MNLPTAVLGSLIQGVKKINKQYAKPQIQMTRFVKICLFTLRLYLFVLVALMIYKFANTLSH